MWGVLDALYFLPELVGGTPTPMPDTATRGERVGLGKAPPALPVLPELWTSHPLPAILLVAELLPLSSWPVTGGPCFSGTSGCGVTSEEAGDKY